MINIICVKWGTKYSADYVNRLKEMVKQHLPLEHNFYCYTDDPTGVDADVIAIETDFEIYWNKMAIFDMLDGTNIYFDLDIVIQHDISFLLSYELPGNIGMVKCYWKNGIQTDGSSKDPRKRWDMDVNSSVMVFKGRTCADILHQFKQDSEWNMLNFKGVCRYLFHTHGPRTHYFDRGLIYSRLYGYDEKNDQHRKKLINRVKTEQLDYDIVELFDIPDYRICLLNGPTEPWMYDIRQLDPLPSSPKSLYQE